MIDLRFSIEAVYPKLQVPCLKEFKDQNVEAILGLKNLGRKITEVRLQRINFFSENILTSAECRIHVSSSTPISFFKKSLGNIINEVKVNTETNGNVFKALKDKNPLPAVFQEIGKVNPLNPNYRGNSHIMSPTDKSLLTYNKDLMPETIFETKNNTDGKEISPMNRALNQENFSSFNALTNTSFNDVDNFTRKTLSTNLTREETINKTLDIDIISKNKKLSNIIPESSNKVAKLMNETLQTDETSSKENKTIFGKEINKEPKHKQYEMNVKTSPISESSNLVVNLLDESLPSSEALSKKEIASKESKLEPHNVTVDFSSPISISSNDITTLTNKSSPIEASSKENTTIFGKVSSNDIATLSNKSSTTFEASPKANQKIFGKRPKNIQHDINVHLSNPISVPSNDIEGLLKENTTFLEKEIVGPNGANNKPQDMTAYFSSPVSSNNITTLSNRSSLTLETFLKENSTLSGKSVDSEEPKNDKNDMNVNYSTPLSVASNINATFSNKSSPVLEAFWKRNGTIFGKNVDSELRKNSQHDMKVNFSNSVPILSNDDATLSNISVPIVGALSNENSKVVGEGVIDPKEPKKNNEHDMNLNFSNPISISSNVVTTLTNISSPIIEALSKENSTVVRKGVVNPKEPKKEPQDEDINSNHFASFPNKSSPTLEALSKVNRTIFGKSVDSESDMNLNSSNPILISSNNVITLSNISSPIIEDLSKGNSSNVGKGVVHLKETKKESQARNVNFFSPIPVSSNEVTTSSNKSSATLETLLSKRNSTLSGTRVDSKEPKNNQYNMNINFSNPLSVSSNNIASLSNKFSEAFETSSKENRTIFGESVDSRLPIKMDMISI
ncbi:hypothetical protein HHI36_017616 [Cryptolaemus montrouzieri]|uniref:Uncharacterized protein n=1 Tax=Cryptolaemus montrouzieri TaxID=559131 RepID=A0ABD2NND3_9CUCU